MDFPANSKRSKTTAPPEEKEVKRVTSGEVIRRKKPLRKQFAETFVGGDLKTATHYVIFNVLIPAAKDALAEAGASGIEKLIYGDSSKRRSTRGSSSPNGHVSYHQMSKPKRDDDIPRAMSRRGRARHDFEEIVLSDRGEATDVLDRLYDIMGRYGAVSVADLYELVGITPAHTDQKWGWEDLHGADVTRIRGGYLLDLPVPEPLD